MSEGTARSRYPVTVVGAGVIGLTVALTLQRTGRYDVTVIARDIPSLDEETNAQQTSHEWASPWAGAHWRSWATVDDFELQVRNAPEAGVAFAKGVEYFDEPLDCEPWYMIINVPRYLAWLLGQYLAAGGKIVKRTLGHISEAADIVNGRLPIVVNCTALGARSLGGVDDKNMYPVRGQTLLVNAPHIDVTVTRISKNSTNLSYVIPRGDGTVILGGTRQEHSCDQTASSDLIETLYRQVISENVGFRPARKGGVRFEIQTCGKYMIDQYRCRL
ncbi:hypothetical protein EV182_001057 [Spiromyces aspiralis]|uniref:Uncharacterized protein n=1 Tax=Spiromyces aspiralis TaxID=68401 RepID=A0ACC1HGF5_9FUNG|nr:hypothetical protein EV182_001057 [Spiromyces aspiralis]